MCQFTPPAGAMVSVTGAPTLLRHVPPTSRFPSHCQPPSPVPGTLLRRYVGHASGWTPRLLSGPPPPPSIPPLCLPGLGVASVTTIATITQSKPCASLHQSTDLWAASPTPIPSSQIKQKQFASPPAPPLTGQIAVRKQFSPLRLWEGRTHSESRPFCLLF